MNSLVIVKTQVYNHAIRFVALTHTFIFVHKPDKGNCSSKTHNQKVRTSIKATKQKLQKHKPSEKTFVSGMPLFFVIKKGIIRPVVVPFCVGETLWCHLCQQLLQ